MYPSIWRSRAGGGESYPTLNHVELSLVTAPAAEPVGMKAAKLHTRYSTDDQDELVAVYLQAAREKVEQYLRKAIMTQTWDFIADWGPAWVELPYPPLQSVTGVYTVGLDNVETLVPTSVYYVAASNGLVSLNIGQVWPLHRAKAGFRIRFVCGWPDAKSVPAAIKQEILALLAQMDDDRTGTDLPATTKARLETYRKVGAAFRMAKGTSREDILA